MSTRYVPEQRLGFLLKRAQHSYRTRVDDALRPLGLTAPQYAVIAAVGAVAGISNAELARVAFVTPQTMQGVLAGLERAGLLTRSPHPEHGRILGAALTEPGRRVLEQARQRVQAIEHRLVDAVGSKRAADFADLLSRCADGLAADSARMRPLSAASE